MTYDPNAKRGAQIRRSQAISAAIRRDDLQRHAEEHRVEITNVVPTGDISGTLNAGHELTVEVGPKAMAEDVARAYTEFIRLTS